MLVLVSQLWLVFSVAMYACNFTLLHVQMCKHALLNPSCVSELCGFGFQLLRHLQQECAWQPSLQLRIGALSQGQDTSVEPHVHSAHLAAPSCLVAGEEGVALCWGLTSDLRQLCSWLPFLQPHTLAVWLTW